MDRVRVLRLLRSASDSLAALDVEGGADDVRQADPIWLPGVKYLLLSAIEATMDVAQHLCASQGWGPPADNGDAMRLLGRHGVLTEDLAVQMRQAVGFRNVLVHEYVGVDDNIVRARVQDHVDLEAFIRAVTGWLPTD